MKPVYQDKLEERREALKDFFGGDDRDEIPDELLQRIFQFEELMVKYRSAIREVTTKLEILGDELSGTSEHNPIETIQSRIKRPYSIARKLSKRGLPVAVESIAENLNDVAGIRVICPFISDIYAVSEMLQKQDDVRLICLQGLYSKSEIQRVPQPAFNHRDPGFLFYREGKYPSGDPDPDGSDGFLGQFGAPDPVQKRFAGRPAAGR